MSEEAKKAVDNTEVADDVASSAEVAGAEATGAVIAAGAAENTPTVDISNKDSAWGKPPGSDKHERKEKQLSVVYNLMTLLFAALIIAGGFMLPTLMYPVLDFYRTDLVQLAEPSSDPPSKHYFEDPVSLYPWNLYNDNDLRSLTVAERELLDQRGIPNFLIATIRDHGMLLPADTAPYRSQILNAFRCLEPSSSDDSPCFVLMDADFDGNGTPDLQCAVDISGNIISLIFVSNEWDTVQLVTPIIDPAAVAAAAQAAAENQADGGDAGTGGPDGTGGGTGATDGGTTPDAVAGPDGSTLGTTVPDAGSPDAAAQPPDAAGGTNPDVTGGGTGGANGTGGGTTGGGANNTGAGTDTSTGEYRPLEEEENLWSFAYATSREANLVNQSELFTAFRQLDLNFENRFGYPYANLLPTQIKLPEGLPEVQFTQISPNPLSYGDYLLYIYNLSNDEWLILYINPSTMRCMGFNLMNNAP